MLKDAMLVDVKGQYPVDIWSSCDCISSLDRHAAPTVPRAYAPDEIVVPKIIEINIRIMVPRPI